MESKMSLKLSYVSSAPRHGLLWIGWVMSGKYTSGNNIRNAPKVNSFNGKRLLSLVKDEIVQASQADSSPPRKVRSILV